MGDLTSKVDNAEQGKSLAELADAPPAGDSRTFRVDPAAVATHGRILTVQTEDHEGVRTRSWPGLQVNPRAYR